MCVTVTLVFSFWITYTYAFIQKLTDIAVKTAEPNQNPIHSHRHFKQNWDFMMSPRHPGQLNTSHYSWHHSKGSLTLLTNHQSQSEKHPITLANPYMGNAGQHPHKWQEIELLEKMCSVWALERHLFIHS